MANDYLPIAYCAFCGDDATMKASDGTPLCENCAPMYKPRTNRKCTACEFFHGKCSKHREEEIDGN